MIIDFSQFVNPGIVTLPEWASANLPIIPPVTVNEVVLGASGEGSAAVTGSTVNEATLLD